MLPASFINVYCPCVGPVKNVDDQVEIRPYGALHLFLTSMALLSCSLCNRQTHSMLVMFRSFVCLYFAHVKIPESRGACYRVYWTLAKPDCLPRVRAKVLCCGAYGPKELCLVSNIILFFLRLDICHWNSSNWHATWSSQEDFCWDNHCK